MFQVSNQNKTTTTVLHIPANTLIGFKALPTPSFHVQPSALYTDWSAIYPQLSLSAAISYLPNQFDRGCKSAVIVSLTCVKNIKIIVCIDKVFTDPHIDSVLKADMVKRMISAYIPENSLETEGLLLDELGKQSFILCLPDADGLELVVPHCLFNKNWFSMEPLFEFTFGQWANIINVKEKIIPKHILDDNATLGHHLEESIDKGTATELIAQLKKIFIE
jgi:hypothetical protein